MVTALSLVDVTQTLNSFVTIQGDDTSGINFVVGGTDVYGNALTETAAGPATAMQQV